MLCIPIAAHVIVQPIVGCEGEQWGVDMRLAQATSAAVVPLELLIKG